MSEQKPENILKFQKRPFHARPMPKDDAEVVQLDLPSADRLTPAGMCEALSRGDALLYERAVIIMTKQEKCPCGCGAETEVAEVFTAGDMHNERINWTADKLKMWALGFDIGEPEL